MKKQHSCLSCSHEDELQKRDRELMSFCSCLVKIKFILFNSSYATTLFVRVYLFIFFIFIVKAFSLRFGCTLMFID